MNMLQFPLALVICKLSAGYRYLSLRLWRITIMIGRYERPGNPCNICRSPPIFFVSIRERFVLMTWER